MSVLSELNRLIDYATKANNLPDKILVPASDKYLRKVLRIKKTERLTHRGLPLIAVGSKLWQKKQQQAAQDKFNAAQIDFVQAEEDRRFGQPNYGHSEIP